VQKEDTTETIESFAFHPEKKKAVAEGSGQKPDDDIMHFSMGAGEQNREAWQIRPIDRDEKRG
jgi:hypothetical protein